MFDEGIIFFGKRDFTVVHRLIQNVFTNFIYI
jgi:hypothetical protein